jgi:hypothetical protein
MKSLLSLAFFTLVLPLSAADIEVKLSGNEGPYDMGRWKKDWPGCKFQDGIQEGNVSLVKVGETPALRVDYTVGQIGPQLCGAGWRWPIQECDAAEMHYTVRFGKDFDWVRGGKLPGLCGGPENVSGGRPADGTNGWSARLMWRKEGKGEAYVYHKNQPEKYGESFDFPKAFRFPTEKDIHVTIRVVMNTPGKKDGLLEVDIAIEGSKPQTLVKEKEMEWRTVKSFSIDSLYFETFHGGSDSSWAPTKPCHATFRDLRVVTK